MSGLKVGDAAPDISLPDQDGKQVQLSSYWTKGPLVVFFYPSDMSYGCTKEVCKFRDGYEDFLKDGASAVIGISKDGAEKHTQFKQKQNLQFSLLSDDKDHSAQKAFKVKKQLFGLVPGRVTFVIDTQGKIASVFSSATDFGAHVDKAKEAVKKLAAPAAPAPTATTNAGATTTSSAAPVQPAAASSGASDALPLITTDATAISAADASQAQAQPADAGAHHHAHDAGAGAAAATTAGAPAAGM